MEQIEYRSDIVGFLRDQESLNDFRDFMERLLSSFMPAEYVKIYMSEEVKQVAPRKKSPLNNLPSTEDVVMGVDVRGAAQGGPFAIIRRAFMHEYVSTINLETLETLGDAVLGEVVAMIIVSSWPNLLKEARQVANMKKFYTNNVAAARFAEKLGFLRWFVRLEKQGLSAKERADIFESFIGAIVLVGEFYIGDQMGLMMARLFLNKFLAQEEWYPENPAYYDTPENLWNDFVTSSDKKDAPVKDFLEVQDREDENKWFISLRMTDKPRTDGTKGPIEEKTGKKTLKFTSTSRSKQIATTEVYNSLNATMKITNQDIIAKREAKRLLQPDVNEFIKKIEEYGVKQTPPQKLVVSNKKKRANTFFLFVQEEKTQKVGGKLLKYNQTVVKGMGATELDAIKDAYNNLLIGRRLITIVGTDEDLDNDPDEILSVPFGKNQGGNNFKKQEEPHVQPQRPDRPEKSDRQERQERSDRPNKKFEKKPQKTTLSALKTTFG